VDLSEPNITCRGTNGYRYVEEQTAAEILKIRAGRVVQDRIRQRHNHWAGRPALLMERMEHTHCGRRFVDTSLDVPFSSFH
jgi:hypothetical protein